MVNQGPAVGPALAAGPGSAPAVFGTVATIRDRTEIESLGTELETMRTLSDALRAQTHEHANRLHTMVSLLELGRTQEALDFATKDLELSQQLTDDMVGSVDEPVLSALVMGKAAEAHERGVELAVAGVGLRRGRPAWRSRTWSPSWATCWTTPSTLPPTAPAPSGWS